MSGGGFSNEGRNSFAAGKFGFAKEPFVETQADAVQVVDFQAFGEVRGVADQPVKFVAQSVSKCAGESREQNPAFGLSTRQEDRPVQGDDGFAGAG